MRDSVCLSVCLSVINTRCKLSAEAVAAAAVSLSRFLCLSPLSDWKVAEKSIMPTTGNKLCNLIKETLLSLAIERASSNLPPPPHISHIWMHATPGNDGAMEMKAKSFLHYNAIQWKRNDSRLQPGED